MNKNVRIAKQLIKIAKNLISSEWEEKENIINSID